MKDCKLLLAAAHDEKRGKSDKSDLDENDDDQAVTSVEDYDKINASVPGEITLVPSDPCNARSLELATYSRT